MAGRNGPDRQRSWVFMPIASSHNASVADVIVLGGAAGIEMASARLWPYQQGAMRRKSIQMLNHSLTLKHAQMGSATIRNCLCR